MKCSKLTSKYPKGFCHCMYNSKMQKNKIVMCLERSN